MKQLDKDEEITMPRPVANEAIVFYDSENQRSGI